MDPQTNTSLNNKNIKLDFKDSKYATGRRKTSIAKVWLKKGSGKIHVNGKIMAGKPVPKKMLKIKICGLN